MIAPPLGADCAVTQLPETQAAAPAADPAVPAETRGESQCAMPDPGGELPPACKVGVIVKGRGEVATEIHLLAAGEPAIRLSSLLDLCRDDLPQHHYARMRNSPSAHGLLTLTELASFGFAFSVTGNALEISLRS